MKAHPDKATPDEVSQQKANKICQVINHARNILQERFENSSVKMNDENSKEEYKWGSGGEYGDGWGPGFGEEDGYDFDESESHVTESMILEAFKMLGLDLTTELTRIRLVLCWDTLGGWVPVHRRSDHKRQGMGLLKEGQWRCSRGVSVWLDECGGGSPDRR